MKMTLCIPVLAALLVFPLLGAVSESRPPRTPAKVSISQDDFRKGSAHKTQEITLASGEKLTVDLGSNPSTGYSWGEKAGNSDPAVVKQVKHERIGPKQPMPGAGGSQSWTFEAIKTGTSTLDFSYDRPWQGGEKGTWTLKLKVTVQ